MSKTLLKNIGCLYSGNIEAPVIDADSLLVEDGKITAFGKGLSVDPDTEVIDVKGTTVMPGLIDSHTHPVIGDWTPRQTALNWIDPYLRAGVTGLVSVGETHIPGKPKDAVGMRALATVAKQTFDNVRPSNMKVYGGAYIMHKDAPEEDFKDLAAMGVKATGEIGLGSANRVETAAEKVKWAKEAGMTVTCHRGAAYLHGSNVIDAETILGLNPTVICHVTLGRIPFEEIKLYFEETTSYIELCRGQMGSIRESAEVIRLAKERDELRRVLLGNNCPSGFGIFPHGIWELVALLTTCCDMSPAQAVACATGNNASAFKLDTGMIAPGRCADLIVCDAPVGSTYQNASQTLSAGVIPGVSLVMVDGKVVVEAAKVNTAPAKVTCCR